MNRTDVCILGGGLAGLTLARQLTLRCPELSVTVLERNRHPVPVAAHKVGESTVEVGAHYLADTLELREYLNAAHLKKFGLRCFFGDAGNIAGADELGASESLPVSSYQIDRGLLENHLGALIADEGVLFQDNCRVSRVEFDSHGHGIVNYQCDNTDGNGNNTLKCRWIVDASGRRGLFRRQFKLDQANALKGNSVWFRVDQAVRIDDWSTDPQWHDRIACGERWLSTNHLMGKGYWVWLIPLASGATSIGVVADSAFHSPDSFSRHDRVMDWFSRHQPQCADALKHIEPMDFGGVNDYSYGCKRVISNRPHEQNWALTGEAGLFLDPFYSPGTDFICYANTFITNIIADECHGIDAREKRVFFQQLYQSFYASSLSLYRDQYGGFGNFRLMSLKTVWDYAYYWAVLGFLAFNDALTNQKVYTDNLVNLARIRQRHDQLQARFTQYAARCPMETTRGAFTDHRKVPVLYSLNAALADTVEPGAQPDKLADNIRCLDRVADEIESMIPGDAGHTPASGTTELLGDLSLQLAS